ncbi:hypothetical protein C0J52_10928 [Blattella germanica]|nr:hypothetical protein C0J52_10928 [Blattella germanica]
MEPITTSLSERLGAPSSSGFRLPAGHSSSRWDRFTSAPPVRGFTCSSPPPQSRGKKTEDPFTSQGKLMA